jgi:GntR family transcriptional regulator
MAGEAADDPGFRPLYKQVREALVRRIAERVWPPGHPLPSEMELAAELNVSQGTVRKALDEMAQDNLVVRRQGRGTFVGVHDEKRILFQFFKLVPDDGHSVFPESRVIAVEEGPADEAERARLRLEDRREAVIRIRRVRSLGGAPSIVETIRVPSRLFPGLAAGDIPNNVYALYADRFGISVARAREKLKAVNAAPEVAGLIGVAPGTARMEIDRTALAVDGAVVEWRLSLCRTDRYHYLSDLR